MAVAEPLFPDVGLFPETETATAVGWATVYEPVAVAPAEVTVTEYVAAVRPEMVAVVAPFDQR